MARYGTTSLSKLISVKTMVFTGLLAGTMLFGGCAGGSSVFAVDQKGDKGDTGPVGPPGAPAVAVEFQLQKEFNKADEPSKLNYLYTFVGVNPQGAEVTLAPNGGITPSAVSEKADGSVFAKLPKDTLIKVKVTDPATNAIANTLVVVKGGETIDIKTPDLYATEYVINLIRLGGIRAEKIDEAMLEAVYKQIREDSSVTSDWDTKNGTLSVYGRQDTRGAIRNFKTNPFLPAMNAASCAVPDVGAAKFDFDTSITQFATGSTLYSQFNNYDKANSITTSSNDLSVGYAIGPVTQCKIALFASTTINLVYTIMGNDSNVVAGGVLSNTLDTTAATRMTCGKFSSKNDVIPGVVAQSTGTSLVQSGGTATDLDVAAAGWYFARIPNETATDSLKLNYKLMPNAGIFGAFIDGTTTPVKDVVWNKSDGITINTIGGSAVTNIVFANDHDGDLDSGALKVTSDTRFFAMSASDRCTDAASGCKDDGVDTNSGTDENQLDSASKIWVFDRCSESSETQFTATDGTESVQLSFTGKTTVTDTTATKKRRSHIQMAVAIVDPTTKATYADQYSRAAEFYSANPSILADFAAKAPALTNSTTLNLQPLEVAWIIAASGSLCQNQFAFGDSNGSARGDYVEGRAKAARPNAAVSYGMPNIKVVATVSAGSPAVVTTHSNETDDYGRASFFMPELVSGASVSYTLNGTSDAAQTCSVK